MKLPMPQIDLLGELGTAEDDEVRAQVWGLLTALYPHNDLVERRQDNRYPFPCLLHLTPVGDDDVTPQGRAGSGRRQTPFGEWARFLPPRAVALPKNARFDRRP